MKFVTDPAMGQLFASLCREPSTRLILNASDQHPHRFYPNAVFVPGTSDRFSEAEAWELIAKLIEDRHAIRIVELNIPPGAIGYQMKVKIDSERDELYVKFTLNKKSTKIIGRSFHYTD